MTLYEKVACVAFVGLLFYPRNTPRRPVGSAILAVVWPSLLVMVGYYGLKKLAGRPGVSARYGEVEATLCLLVGCLLVPVVLYFQGSPVILQAVHSIWG
jgi:hypothetical protein